MDCRSIAQTFLAVLFALLVGQGDGQWKKSSREMLQHDLKIFKDMSEKIKEELGGYYDEYTDEPFTDYFLEEIDYLQSKIRQHMHTEVRKDGIKDIRHFHNDNLNKNRMQYKTKAQDKDLTYVKFERKNVTLNSNFLKITWPKFEDILLEMGKKYDWKNDRWIKVKNKIRDKNKSDVNTARNKEVHSKHNFRYKIVKLNREKNKRNIVIAVTAVR